MRSLPVALLLFVILSCGKKDIAETSAASDSTAVARDTVPAETVSEQLAAEPDTEEYLDAPPPGSFAEDHYPEDEVEIDSIEFFNVNVWPEIYTDKPEERAAVEGVIRMMLDYKKLTLEPVKRSFKRKYKNDYEDEGGQPYTSVTSEKGSETWLFDSTGSVRVYINVFKQNDDMDGFKYLKTIYLFSGDSMVAGYQDSDEANQIAFNNKIRFVTALCPSCGGSVDNDTGSSFYAFSAYTPASIKYPEEAYRKKRDRIMRELKEGFPNAKPSGNGKVLKYTVTGKEEYPADTYKANLEIGKALYDKLFGGV